MSVPLNRIPNESALAIIQAGFEAQRGVAATPTFKLYGDLKITSDMPLQEVAEYDGSFDRDIDPTFGPMSFGGTYTQGLTYEDGPILCELGVKGGVTGVTDGNATPGYSYEYQPTRKRDDLRSLTVEHGFPGMPARAEMLMVNDFTISADIDDSEAAWKYSGNLWTRYDALLPVTAVTATGGSTTTLVKSAAGWTSNQWAGAFLNVTSGVNAGETIEILSNDATTLTFVGALPAAIAAAVTAEISGVFTAGITDRVRERIQAPGTKLFEADLGATLTNFEVKSGFISFSVTHTNGLNGKRFMNDTDRFSRKIGRDKRYIMGQIRREFDTRKQRDNWLAKKPQQMRIEQTGSVIDSGASSTKLARLDFTRIYWGSPTEDTRGSNLTLTMPFTAFLNSSSGDRAKYTWKTANSTVV